MIDSKNQERGFLLKAPTHIYDYLELNAAKTPDKLALITDDREMSWHELNQEVQVAANSLEYELGPQTQQEIISLLFPNSWQFVVAYLAILKVGHIAMPLDPSYKSLEIDAILRQVPPKLIITDGQQVPDIHLQDIKTISSKELLKSGAARDNHYLKLPAKEQVATLLFTSGTTGKPKAATYSHANHIWNIKVCSQVWNWTSNDSLLISLPLSHWYGIVMGLAGIIYHGNTLYLQKWFDEEATLRDLSAGKATMYTAISAAYFKLLEQSGNYDLSSVRLCISGGAALPPAIWQSFKERFGVEILECYGSSESGRIASNLLDERIPGSPGRPLPEVQLKLSDGGEVLIKSPGVFPGYYKNPSLTKKGFTPDGWWKTGDLGELQNGRIVLKGRLQERIRKQGYSISPRDIEWAMHQNPRIKEVYVMGVQKPDQPSDELIYFIKSNMSLDEINEYCKANLLYAWRPDKIVLVEALPRTKNGKPSIKELEQMAGVN